MFRILGLALVLCLCINVCFAEEASNVKDVSAPKNQPTVKQPQPNSIPTPNHQGTEKAPFVVKILDSPNSEAKAREDKKDKQEQPTTDWLLVISSFLLVGIGWWQARKQAEFTRESMEITRQAVDAAVKGAEIAEREMHITVRAYLIIEQFTPYDSSDKTSIMVSYHINNLGKTAGKVFCHKEVFQIVENLSELPVEPVVDSIEGVQIEASIPTGGGFLFHSDPFVKPPNFEDDIESGRKLLCLSAQIEYRDVLGKEQKTRISRVYRTLRKRGEGVPPASELIPNANYNIET